MLVHHALLVSVDVVVAGSTLCSSAVATVLVVPSDFEGPCSVLCGS